MLDRADEAGRGVQGHAAAAEVRDLGGLPSFVCCLRAVKIIDFPVFEHDKGERPEACPKKMVSWLASLALYKCRPFGPRFLTGYYFKPGGGVLTRQDRA